MVVALDDVRKREYPSRIERSRGLADAIAAGRRLVKYEGKTLIEPAYGPERRLRGCGVNYCHRKAVQPEIEDGAFNCHAT